MDTNVESRLAHSRDRTDMNPGIPAEAKRRQLRQRLAAPGLIIAPGVFDMISARIADRMGFEAVWEFDRAHAQIQPAGKPGQLRDSAQ